MTNLYSLAMVSCNLASEGEGKYIETLESTETNVNYNHLCSFLQHWSVMVFAHPLDLESIIFLEQFNVICNLAKPNNWVFGLAHYRQVQALDLGGTSKFLRI